jgi:Na+/H+ antiporter NhaD/arsenite permease-like protein
LKEKICNNKIINYLKGDVVFVISFLLALITSMISVPKLSYINFKVLIIMFNLMIIISAFERLRLLDKIAVTILNKHKNFRMVSLILIALCFLSSMLITNDVALIIFIPLTLIMARKAKFEPINIIVFQTLAANIGSALMPMGNPQNLYLFSFYKINFLDFIYTISPFVITGSVLLFVLNYRISNIDLQFNLIKVDIEKHNIIIYLFLFILIILSVLNVVNYQIVFIITLLIIFILERKLFKEVDYLLLLTFLCFFIAIGNLSNLKSISKFMKMILTSSKSIYLSAIIFSQLISNFPSAILLSKFTNSWKEILIGTNIGGIGTLIASLASLISYRLYSKKYNDGKNYLIQFTKYNLVSLIIITIISYICFNLQK